MDKKVRDIMTPNPVGVYYDQTIAEAAQLMRDAGVGAALVVNGDLLGGVVTDRDLVVRGLAEGVDADAPVGPLCSSQLVGVDAGADIADAELLMQENAVRRLPVIEDEQIVGIISMGDIAVCANSESSLAAVSRTTANT
jgi:signal-transduction protein with cAMP-binding, CBS, and nucleotidyltransferase domain